MGSPAAAAAALTPQSSSTPQSSNIVHGPIPLNVATPSNNPHMFQSMFYQRPPRPPVDSMAMGGSKNEELMSRIQMAFQSRIESEEDWALDALLQLSFNQPELLNLKKLPDTTKFLLSRITNAPFFLNQPSESVLATGSMSQTDEEYEQTQKVLHAMLIVRNASLTPTNAHFMSQLDDCKRIVERGLALPNISIYSEFRMYCIEIAEAISFHVTPESPTDTFFLAIVSALASSDDRGLIVPALRSLARIVVHDKKNIMESIPVGLVEEVIHYLLVDDEELISASLDFLYQYTASKRNVGTLFSTPMGTNLCTKHLVRLLTYRIVEPQKDYIRLPRRTKKVAPANPPSLPDELVDELLQLDEPARATQWIRCSYEEDPNAEVTQISLWKAYEGQFSEFLKQGRGKAPLLPGVHFINNVTPAFKRSAAMVINLPTGHKSYIIKGIKPREFAVTPAQLNAPPPPPPVQENRQPSTFGVTACLVLQNIAHSKEGNDKLQHTIPALMRAMLLNSTIHVHVQELLDELTGNIGKVE